MIAPATVAGLAEAVLAHPRVLAVGAGTKPRLSATDAGCVPLSTRALAGVVEYEPDEYTFTALAGTPLRDLVGTLAERGQYLPFDPPLVERGATLGGTVAAGLSGPGRLRFGGLRDFILGVRFVDGRGRLLRLGGKVVKNAAGFDLPKFFVGGLGRFGVLAELTFKVFPRPPASLTLRLPLGSPAEAVSCFAAIGRSRWEAEAVDLVPDGDALLVRLAGPAAPLGALAREILAHRPGEILDGDVAADAWRGLNEQLWADAGDTLLKIALAPGRVPELLAAVRALGGRAHVSAAGNVAFVALPPSADPAGLGFPALTLRGPGPLWIRPPPAPRVAAAVKAALDPEDRFPPLL